MRKFAQALLYLGLLMAVGIGPGLALADGELKVSIVAVDDSKFPDVTAIVMADLHGRPIADLRPEDIRVEDLGVPAQVLSVRRAGTETPLALVLVIDTSGSMGQEYGGGLAQAQEAAITLLGSLQPGDRVALISFANDVVVQVPFTQDRGAVINAIRGLQAYGNTALYQAVAEAARLAGEAGLFRRAVIFLTDGQDFGGRSQVGRDESLNLAAALAPQFLVIGVGRDIDREYLQELAARTQGRYVEAAGPAEIVGAFRALSGLLRSHLEVTYRVQNDLGLTNRQVKVTLSREGAVGTAERAYTNRNPVVLSPSPLPQQPNPAPEPRVLEPEPLLRPLELALLGAVILGLVGAAGVSVVRHFRSRPTPLPDLPFEPLDLPPPTHTSPGSPDRVLVSLAGGPPGTPEKVFSVGAEPQTIGWAESCQIRLPQAPGVAAEHVRVWLQDARLILHHLSPETTTLVNGEPVVWASVGQGDEFKVGPYIFTCLAMVSATNGLPSSGPAPRSWQEVD
ncbi:MAG: hypothetical protein C4315_02445 [Chloroflexota bacterium]